MKGFQDIHFFSNETYEYAFSSVPRGKRKATGRLVLILTGVTFSSSGLMIGAEVGKGMSFGMATGACLAGNLFLFLVALFWGMLGYRSGYTSVYGIKKRFGNKVAAVFAFLIISYITIWIGVNGDLLARIIISSCPIWPLPISVTTMLLIVLGIGGARYGWRGIEIISRICVPVILLLTIYNIFRFWEMKEGFKFLLHFEPDGYLSVPTAVTMIVGTFSLSTMTMPDTCRFAKNKRGVFICAVACALTMMISNLCGILIVQETGANSLNYGIFLLGMVVQNFIWMMLSVYTTQNINMYIGSLAIQNLVRETTMGGNISHKSAVYFIGGLSVIMGVAGSAEHLQEITSLLIMTMMPLTGITFVDALYRELLKRKKQFEYSADSLKVKEWIPLTAWGAGIGKRGVMTRFMVGQKYWILSLLFSAVVYGILRVRYGIVRLRKSK